MLHNNYMKLPFLRHYSGAKPTNSWSLVFSGAQMLLKSWWRKNRGTAAWQVSFQLFTKKSAACSDFDLSLTDRALSRVTTRWWSSELNSIMGIPINHWMFNSEAQDQWGLEVKTPPSQVQHLSHAATINKSHDFKFVPLFWNLLQSFQLFCGFLILVL